MGEVEIRKMDKIGPHLLLFVLFLELKLCGLVDWEWRWVLCPLWLPILQELAAIIWGEICNGKL
jgi:hypothetical protein